MKKQMTRITLVLGFAALVWILLTWFIGFKTEQQVRQMLDNGGLAKANHTLLDYQRSLFSAQAITRLDVRNTPLGTWTDELRFRHIIKHGPLMWRPASAEDVAEFPAAQKSLLTALSQWRTQLDLSAIDQEERRLLKVLFANQVPLQAESVIDYSGMVGYQASLATLQGVTGLDKHFGLAGLQLAGQLDPKLKQPQAINIRAGKLQISNEDSQLLLPELKLTLHLNEMTQKPERRLGFMADEVVLQIAETDETIRFKLRGETAYRTDNNAVNGSLQLTLDDFSAARYPLNELTFNADFSGINALGLQWVNQLQQRLQDAQAQQDWYEEDIEVPESRRAIRQLGVESEAIANELLQALFYKMLQRDQSRLIYTLNIATELGDLQQKADLTYAGTERRMALNKVMNYGMADWLTLVRGEVQFAMDQSMLPVEFKPMINYPLQKQALLAEDEQYRMQLRLTGYDAELNGKVYAYDSLAGKITPKLSTLFQRTSAAVSPDIMSRIETQGLNDEVLKALAQEESVSAETLELLMQLKEMNEKLQ